MWRVVRCEITGRAADEKRGGDASERYLRGTRHLLQTLDIHQDGDVTVAALNEGVLVALAGQIPAERLWVEVTPTGDSLNDLPWGRLPLYEVLHCSPGLGRHVVRVSVYWQQGRECYG